MIPYLDTPFIDLIVTGAAEHNPEHNINSLVRFASADLVKRCCQKRKFGLNLVACSEPLFTYGKEKASEASTKHKGLGDWVCERSGLLGPHPHPVKPSISRWRAVRDSIGAFNDRIKIRETEGCEQSVNLVEGELKVSKDYESVYIHHHTGTYLARLSKHIRVQLNPLVIIVGAVLDSASTGPWPGHCFLLLGKTLYSHDTSI